MATSGLTFQDVIWVQGTSRSASLDVSQPGIAVARRTTDYQGFSFSIVWTGSPVGNMSVLASNASVFGDKLVEPANWVKLDPLNLAIGTGMTPASSPALLQVSFGRAGWASLLWTPSGTSSGTLTSKFDGVRK